MVFAQFQMAIRPFAFQATSLYLIFGTLQLLQYTIRLDWFGHLVTFFHHPKDFF